MKYFFFPFFYSEPLDVTVVTSLSARFEANHADIESLEDKKISFPCIAKEKIFLHCEFQDILEKFVKSLNILILEIKMLIPSAPLIFNSVLLIYIFLVSIQNIK